MGHDLTPSLPLSLIKTYMYILHKHTHKHNQTIFTFLGWQPEDPYLQPSLLWKMTKCNTGPTELGCTGCGCGVGGVTVIRISLWLTRWGGRSLKSQGSWLRRPPSNTSPHLTGPTSFYYWAHPLFSLPFVPHPSLCLSTSLLRSIREMKNGVQLAEHFLPLVRVSSSLCW